MAPPLFLPLFDSLFYSVIHRVACSYVRVT